jgi:hypothetical protein
MQNIDFTILDKAIEVLKDGKVLDDETIGYFPKRYKFTVEEYNKLFESLTDKDKDDCTELFEEYRRYFEYKNVKFIWRLLIGQGAACQLLPAFCANKSWPSKRFPMKFKEEKKIVINEKV